MRLSRMLSADTLVLLLAVIGLVSFVLHFITSTHLVDRVIKPRFTAGTVFAVLASHDEEKAEAVLQTWGRHVDVRLIAVDQDADVELSDRGDTPEGMHPTTAVPRVAFHEHGFPSMGRKAMKAWIHLCGVKARWYILVDDDTFVVPRNLQPILESYNPLFPHYLGYVLNHTAPAMIGGGGGIVLSYAAHRMLCNASSYPTMCNPKLVGDMPGDLATSYCMEDLDVTAEHVDGFYPFPPDKIMSHIDNWCKTKWWAPKHLKCPPSPHAISFHYINASRMYELYYWAYQFRRY